MCGRYASFREAQDIADTFDVVAMSDDVLDQLPSWNVAPTTSVKTIVDVPVDSAGEPVKRSELDKAEQVQRQMRLAHWGLIPIWAKDTSIGSRMINARAETIAEKKSFAPPLRTSRVILPADGYFEWQAPPEGRTGKTPHYIHRQDGQVLAFAGIFSWWKDPQRGEWLMSVSIATREAEGPMTELHHRVPVVLESNMVDAWLDPSLQDSDEAVALLDNPLPELTWHEVSRQVNAVRNNSEANIEAAT